MNAKQGRAGVEDLLEHAGWMRKLAFELVGDAQGADDLAQEAWVRVLQRPPRADRPLRGFLATVMRNLRSQELRSKASRSAREEDAARGEAQPSPDELVERLAVQRHLAEVVADLDEPYRSTLILRYYEGATPRKLAAQLGIPISTVKTRLARGLDLLRQKLDQRHGGDRALWIGALLPIVDRPLPGAMTAAAAAGGLVMNVKLVLAVVALSAVGATWAVLTDRDGEEPSVQGPDSIAAAEPRAPAKLVGADDETPPAAPVVTGTRRRAETPTLASREDEPADVLPGQVRGRVVPLGGVAIEGLPIGNETHRRGTDREGAVRTAADGTFQLALAQAGSRMRVETEEVTTVLSAQPVSTGRAESTIVVAPRVSYGGTVLDENGNPIEGADLVLHLPPNLRGSIGAVLDHSVDEAWQATTDEQGAFSLPRLPVLSDAVLILLCAGFEPMELAAPVADATSVLHVMEATRRAERLLTGVVVDGAEVPISEALVSFGVDTVETDDLGRFTLDLAREDSFNNVVRGFLGDFEPDALLAVKPGYLPARLEPRGEGDNAWPDHIVLRLGAEPFAISGRVDDFEGNPLVGARVWVADPSFFGGLGDPAADRFPRVTSLENVLAGADPGWNYLETDEDGRFRMGGLLNRSYTVVAMDPRTLLRTQLEDVAAGRDGVVLRFPEDAVFGTLRGRVLSGSGEPIAGVAVFPMCDAFKNRIGDRVIGTTHATRDGVTTDEAGRFELTDVPRDLVYLRLDGPEVLPLEWGRRVEGGLSAMVDRPTEIEITVHVRCHFQVELSDALEADAFSILDATGEPVVISEFVGNGRREGPQHELFEGRSNPMAVADTGVTIVLYKEGVETRRAAIRLRPGDRQLLRP